MSTPPQPPQKKFTFDTEFFELVPGSVSAIAANKSAQSHAEQKQQAYDEGFAAGLKQGHEQAQADLAVMQQHLQNALMALQKGMEERERQLLTQTLAFLHTSLYHLMADVVKRYPDELLEQHLRMVIPLVKADEALTLRIHPLARGYHEKLGLPHASIVGLPMHIVPDGSLGGTDAVVEWKNGGVESKLTQHLAQISQLLAAAGVPMLPTPAMPEPAPLAEPAATQPAAKPEAAPPPPSPAPAPVADAMSQAEKATRSRAAELLGDDDLVDALKSK